MTACMVNLNAGTTDNAGVLCRQAAVYKAWVISCTICRLSDFPDCVGHPVCIQHGAEMRAHAMPDSNEMTTLLRLCSLNAK